ncbi:MAG: hypothetical protein ACI4RA_05275, partial [Kiritimatiellia bacterium]
MMRKQVAVACAFGIVGGLFAEPLAPTVTESGKALTWSAAASTIWDEATANWTDALGAAAVFSTYDRVTFGARAGTIEVAEGGVTPGEMTINGAGEYAFTGGQIGGAATITIDGGAVVGLGAKLDAQPIVVKSGVLRPTVTASDLLGSPEVPITVLDGGTFDMNNRAGTDDDRQMTHNKKYRIAGAGATVDGVKQGAIVNRGPVSDTLGRIHSIELIGDAMIKGGTGRWDMRKYGDGANTGRPQVTGGHTLTIGGETVTFSDTDVDVGGLVITNGATLNLENSTRETVAEGVRVQQGNLYFWNHANPFTAKIIADGPAPRVGAGSGTATVAGEVHVAAGTTLDIRCANYAATRFTGGIFGPGALRVIGDVQYFACDVEQDELTVRADYAVYGDMTAAGNEKKWPK